MKEIRVKNKLQRRSLHQSVLYGKLGGVEFKLGYFVEFENSGYFSFYPPEPNEHERFGIYGGPCKKEDAHKLITEAIAKRGYKIVVEDENGEVS